MPTGSESRLVIISFDGLSLEQAQLLGKRLACLSGQSNQLLPLSSAPLTCAQAIWSELLTGKRWFENGCPGYARPQSSLNDLKILDEHDLNQTVSLVPASGSLVANVPLLTPLPGRLWLSDGSLPVQTVISPARLVEHEPFNHYRGRPFASANVAMRDVRASVLACLKVETVRLQCFGQLLSRKDCRTAVLRISVFDLLAHLLGDDFLQAGNLLCSPEIDGFIALLDQTLRHWQNQFAELNFCVLSLYSHSDCRGRVNLNQLLQLGKFCQLASPAKNVADSALARRAQAARLINATLTDETTEKNVNATTTNIFLSAQTLAGSPIAGGIYINDKKRFVDGVVPSDEYVSLLEQVHEYLSDQLTGMFGTGVAISKADRMRPDAPDLTIHIDGVDFYNSADGKVFDPVSKPRSVHAPTGFMVLPRQTGKRADANLPVGVITPIEANRIIRQINLVSDNG